MGVVGAVFPRRMEGFEIIIDSTFSSGGPCCPCPLQAVRNGRLFSSNLQDVTPTEPSSSIQHPAHAILLIQSASRREQTSTMRCSRK